MRITVGAHCVRPASTTATAKASTTRRDGSAWAHCVRPYELLDA
jgi:hypothetical protein